MDLVTPTVHLSLAYVDVLNRAQVPLTSEGLDAYGQAPRKVEPYRRSLFEDLGASSLLTRVEPGESMSAYLRRVGWTSGSNTSVLLSDAGRAVLRHADRPVVDSDHQAVSVIIDPDDPLAYMRIFDLINEHDGGMLIDPYLKLDGLADLVEISAVARVLTSATDRDAKIFARTLKAAESDIQLRFADRSKLHDRFFIADEAVYVLGSSLNSITKRPGVITPVTDPSAVGAITRAYERLWDGATDLEPGSEPDDQDSE